MMLDPKSRCSIQLPANTSYVRINGTLGSQQGTMSVQLSTPPPVDGFPASFSTASTYSILSDLYETPLDPDIVYNLSIAVGPDGPVGIDTVTVWSGIL